MLSLPAASFQQLSVAVPSATAVNQVYALRLSTSDVTAPTTAVLTLTWTQMDDGDGNVTLQSVVVLPCN